jgi:predicted Holliday junction resolvase-like endonuclease
MTNYDYMAIGRKLSKADDRNNMVTGLIISTLVLGGCVYLQYRILKELKGEIFRFKQKIDDLNSRNNRQREIIDELQNTKQELMKQLSKIDDKTS